MWKIFIISLQRRKPLSVSCGEDFSSNSSCWKTLTNYQMRLFICWSTKYLSNLVAWKVIKKEFSKDDQKKTIKSATLNSFYRPWTTNHKKGLKVFYFIFLLILFFRHILKLLKKHKTWSEFIIGLEIIFRVLIAFNMIFRGENPFMESVNF